MEEDKPATPLEDLNENLQERISTAKLSFGKGLDDLLSVGRELITTEEGRRHIGKTMDKAGEEILITLEETAKTASDNISSFLEKKRKE